MKIEDKNIMLFMNEIFGGEFSIKPESMQQFRSIIFDKINTLTEREAMVIYMRFGLKLCNAKHTQQAVGNYLRISPSRVHQIQYKALRKMRHPSRSEELFQLLDIKKENQNDQ